MVLYFTCIDPSYVVYMGRDKFENEDLIKYHFPEDVWFHVDDFSSAHVYLRLKQGQTIQEIPKEMVEDLAQLTKENSIKGSKEPQVKVIYTMASNLRKSGDMDTGEVGFHDRKAVYSVTVRRDRDIINRIKKTKIEKEVDFEKERNLRDKEERESKKKAIKEKQKLQKEALEKKQKEQEEKSYDNLFNEKKKSQTSNKKYHDDDFFGGEEEDDSTNQKSLDDLF
ncbi:hypothetical protein ABK040_003432 [Willaertia magna]